MIIAAEELKFNYPFSRYRALRKQKADSSPMTLEEVKRFLDYDNGMDSPTLLTLSATVIASTKKEPIP